MKKHILTWILTVFAFFVFADAKEELKKIMDNANTKEFSKANNHIDELQERGEQYVSQGKYEQALECYKRALAESDKLFGKNNTAAASSYTAMAIPYIKMGKKIKAAESLVKASEIFKKTMGGVLRPEAGRLLLIQAGFLYFEENQFGKAYTILKEAEKDIDMLSPSEKTEKCPTFYCYLALSCFREKKYKEAIPYLKKSLSLESQKKPINHQELAVIYLFWGEALLETEKLEESLSALLKSEKYFKSCEANVNYQYDLYFSLSTVSEQLGNKEQDLLYAKKLNKICQKLDPQNFRKVMGLICLAEALNANSQKDEAVKLMKQALELAQKQKQSPKSIMRIQKHLEKISEKK